MGSDSARQTAGAAASSGPVQRPQRSLSHPQGSQLSGRDHVGSSSAATTGPRSPHSPRPPHLGPTQGLSPASPTRPFRSPAGSLRVNRLCSPTSSGHSVSSSVGSLHSQAGSFVANSFAYGFYNAGPSRPLPSARVPDGLNKDGFRSGIAKPIPTNKEGEGYQIVSEQERLGIAELEVAIMPLGILNTRDGNAPGTVFAALQDTRENKSSTGVAVAGSMSVENVLDPSLKYDRSGKEPVLLVPQPSDDPNDPLNWPRWRRDIILGILCFMSVIASTLSPLLAADTFSLFIDFSEVGDFGEYNFTDMALLTGYHLLGVGLAGFLFVASARVWGKRHLYLLGCLLVIISSAWGGATGLNYNSLLAARVVQGIGLAPFEALVNASVADLYFVHERGSRMALSNMALFGGAFFTPIIVGKMSFEIGWQWSFYFVAIFAGICFPLLFFFVPETAFSRSTVSIVTGNIQGNGNLPELAAHSDGGPSEEKEGTASSTSGSGHHASPEAGAVQQPQKMSYRQSLLPFSGRKTDEAFWKLVLRPFPLFLHPGVLWACLIQGAIIGWTVLIGVVLAALFIGPPLWFGEVQTGYMYTGPFIGALVGFLLAGLMADWSYRLLTRWNGGVYEPEFRIILVIPQLILGCAGLYGFGATASGLNHGWFLPTFCFALEVAGMVVGAVASALYIADAHNEIAVEAFTCLLIFKNVFSFGLTYGAFDWLSLNGTFNVFIIIGSVQAGVCLLSIPMYIFGKRNRAFFGKHNILKLVGLW